jgi:hypothetical protein
MLLGFIFGILNLREFFLFLLGLQSTAVQDFLFFWFCCLDGHLGGLLVLASTYTRQQHRKERRYACYKWDLKPLSQYWSG